MRIISHNIQNPTAIFKNPIANTNQTGETLFEINELMSFDKSFYLNIIL